MALFGYVQTYRPDLKVREDLWYRGVYCGLCRVLGKRYGLFARMTLNYDFTFLALFRMSLTNTQGVMEYRRCFVHPFSKRPCVASNAQMEFAADAAQLLVYYKWRDTLADEKGIKRLAARLLTLPMRRIHKKAAACRPELDRVFADCMAMQCTAEAGDPPSLDAAAEPTALMMQALVADLTGDARSRRILERFGYCFGRWVYLIDAADDADKDRKSGSFNPYSTGDRADALPSLNACTAECAAAYALLDNRLYDGLIRNILECGMPSVSRRVTEGTYRTRRKQDEGSL